MGQADSAAVGARTQNLNFRSVIARPCVETDIDDFDIDGADLRVGKDIPLKHFAKVDTAFVEYDGRHDSQVAGLTDGSIDAGVFAAAGIVAAGIAATGFLAAAGLRIRGTRRAAGAVHERTGHEATAVGFVKEGSAFRHLDYLQLLPFVL